MADPASRSSPPAGPRATGAVDGSVVTYADGMLQIHDARATLQVLEWAMSRPSDLHQRQWYLSLASACGHWLCGATDPVWPAPDVPVAAAEHWGISVARLAVLHGDQDYLAVVAAYGGIRGLRRRDTLAEVLWRPSASLLCGLDAASHPVGYLAGAVQRTLALRDHQAPQAHMVALDDALRRAVLATPGIDTGEYLDALRATGRAADLRLAADVEAWLAGASQHELGEAAYRRVMRHLRGQRARAIGGRSRGMFTRAVGGAMAPPEWYCTHAGQRDSVWHRRNAHLIR